MFWEGKFTCKENLFLAVDMENCGRRNIRKNKEIRGSDMYINLYISSKFDSPNKMKITCSDFGKIRKGVDYLSGF